MWYYDAPADRWALLRRGDYRMETLYLCLEQQAAGNASAVCFMVADLKALMSAAGPDAYRLAHLEAGVVAQRIHLAAAGMDLACSRRRRVLRRRGPPIPRPRPHRLGADPRHRRRRARAPTRPPSAPPPSSARRGSGSRLPVKSRRHTRRRPRCRPGRRPSSTPGIAARRRFSISARIGLRLRVRMQPHRPHRVPPRPGRGRRASIAHVRAEVVDHPVVRQPPPRLGQHALRLVGPTAVAVLPGEQQVNLDAARLLAHRRLVKRDRVVPPPRVRDRPHRPQRQQHHQRRRQRRADRAGSFAAPIPARMTKNADGRYISRSLKIVPISVAKLATMP